MTGVLWLGLLLFAGPGARAGVLLTDPAQYAGPAFDLGPFANGSYNFGATVNGPAALPNGISLTCGGAQCVLGQGFFGLGSNGLIGLPATYAGVDDSVGYLQLAFRSPLSEFGLFLNYAPGFGRPLIGTYDRDGRLLTEFSLAAAAPVATPRGFNQFQFRGIREESAVIARFRLSNAFMVAAGTPSGALPASVATPEPGTWALCGAGLAGVVAYRRRVRTHR